MQDETKAREQREIAVALFRSLSVENKINILFALNALAGEISPEQYAFAVASRISNGKIPENGVEPAHRIYQKSLEERKSDEY